jgi:hypothetical protein
MFGFRLVLSLVLVHALESWRKTMDLVFANQLRVAKA